MAAKHSSRPWHLDATNQVCTSPLATRYKRTVPRSSREIGHMVWKVRRMPESDGREEETRREQRYHLRLLSDFGV